VSGHRWQMWREI